MSRKLSYLISAVLVLGLVLPRPAGGQEPGLAGWWRLDGDATDSSANNNHGTVVGNPQWVVGKIGDALDFDGVDDHVDCGNAASLDITGPITISAWVYPTGPGGGNYGRILDKASSTSGTGPGYKFYPRAGDNYIVTLSVGGGSRNTRDRVVLNSWNYFAFVATGTQWRVLVNNGPWQQWNDTHVPTSVANPLFIGNGSSGARPFDGILDDVRVYNRALTEEEIEKAMKGSPPRGLPSEPVPDNEATDVPRDVTLSWTPGEFAPAANGHIVYLSENLNDVNDGIGGVRQSASSYTPPQRLDFGTTYYWRVDEASAPPDSKVYKGLVWSFTTEPFAYPIENITATALSSDPGKGPENTVNNSGLNDNDLHSTDELHMWLSQVEPSGAWIQYEFDKVYALHQMLVWNHNSRFEYPIGFGVKEATIEYSLNGSDWITLGTTHEFARATGLDGYAHNTTVDFGGVAAKYVKLTANSNWGGLLKQYGLSEVRFLYKPLRARGPNPASGATGVGPDAVLTWRAGREATRHDVYFGTDQQAVVDGTVPVTSVTAASYDPLSLDLGTTYYWKVNEVNVAGPITLEADVWSFATSEYVVVDDFESYNDIDPPDPESHRIFEAWTDGYSTPTTNGALVGNDAPPYTEQTIIHDGGKSMPFRYNNIGTVTHSEAERTFVPAQDWTKHGVKTLSLWFRGDPNNTGGQLYVKVNGAKIPYGGDASSLMRAGWQWWNIELASFGVSLASVTKLAVGIDGGGASGKLYLDDIRLYAYERRFVTPTEPTAAGLAAHYKLDQNATDSSGNNNHGTLAGGPQWMAGKIGGALQFDGVDDFVDCGNGASLNITGPITISAWVYPTGGGGDGYGRIVDKSNGTGGDAPGYKLYLRAAENYTVTLSAGGRYPISSLRAVLNSWNYVVFTTDGTRRRLFLNGVWEEWNESALPSISSNPLFIGNSPAGARHFQGIIDDVRIYDRALTSGEIAWLGGVTAPFEEPF